MSRARTWLIRTLWFLIILAIVVAFLTAGGVVWLRRAMQAALPQVDGQRRLSAILSPVTVRRDARGVPYIRAQSLDDLLAAQGYVTAQDRLWQMDMLRRMAAGEAAEVLGSGLAEHDRMQRILALRPTAERVVASFSAQDREFFDAYARGVNAAIDEDRREGRLPPEFRLLRYAPRPWIPADSVLVVLAMDQLLDTQWPIKLSRATITARLGPTLAADLYPTGSWRDHPPMQAPADFTQPPPPSPEQPSGDVATSLRDVLRWRRVLAPPRELVCLECLPGSNEWAVSGAHTASGRPLLANDMHLPHQIPNIWYQADLRAGSFHAAGVTLPGLPFIVAGHNAHVAWGYTALGGDTQDLYLEKTNAQGEYWTAAGWRPMERARQTVHVRWGRDLTFDALRTDHGPVLRRLAPNGQTVLSLRWTVYDSALGGMPLYELNSASNWTEFRAALRQWWAPTLNVVYADDAGHIGYQAVGRIPLRPNGLQPAPIADANHEWQGFIPFDALPTAFDPPSGILATANARVTPDGDPYPLTLAWASPYRNERIWKWLAGKDKLTRADMLTLQTDVYSEVDQELSQRFAYAIDHAQRMNARMRTAADLLRSWDGVVGVNSPAAAIVYAAKSAFWPLVLAPRLGQDWELYDWPEASFAEEQLITHSPAAWLPPAFASWDDLLAAAVANGLKAAHAPGDLRRWRYGQDHVVEFQHPLYGLLPFFRWTGVGPLAQSGDGTTVKQVSRSFGPSQRFTMDWADVDGSTENIVLGESGNPASAHYRDQWSAWYGGASFAMPFTDAAIAAATRHTLELTP